MSIKTIVETALNTSTYTAIEVPAASGRNLVAKTDDDTSFLVSHDSAGTTKLTIPADKNFAINKLKCRAGTIFYAKAVSGTPTLEVAWD